MLTGADLSIVALVGIVLLMGIVKKNGILVVDFALEAERTRGLSPEEAAVEACVLRFRPIMMTTAAALLGSLPLVLERGTGSGRTGRRSEHRLGKAAQQARRRKRVRIGFRNGPQHPRRRARPRVLRGGSWNDNQWNCRAGSRDWLRTGDRYGIAGFRLARTY